MGLSLKWTPIMALFYVGISGLRLKKICANNGSLLVTLRWGWDEEKYTQIIYTGKRFHKHLIYGSSRNKTFSSRNKTTSDPQIRIAIDMLKNQKKCVNNIMLTVF